MFLFFKDIDFTFPDGHDSIVSNDHVENDLDHSVFRTRRHYRSTSFRYGETTVEIQSYVLELVKIMLYYLCDIVLDVFSGEISRVNQDRGSWRLNV